MELTYASFLSVWQIIALALTGLSLIAGFALLIIHRIRFSSIRDYKQKYDYLAANDSKMIFYIIISFAVALTLFINTVYITTASYLSVFMFIFLSKT